MAESLNIEKNEVDLYREKRGFFQKLREDIDELYEEGKVSVSGPSFITHLTSMYWGCRGIPENLADLALPVMLDKTLKVSSASGQIIMSMVFTPWAMKPFFAVLSDVFPMAYYKKRFYMVIVSALGCLGSFLLWSSSPEALGMGTANTAFAYFVLVHLAISMCDSLSQGKYTEICKWKGATVVSYVAGSKVLAGAVAAVLAPRVNDSGVDGPQKVMLICCPFFAQALVVQAMNFMGDRKLDKCCMIDKSILEKDSRVIITGVCLGLIALLVVSIQLASSLTETDYSFLMMPTAGAGIVIILSMTFWSLPTRVASINVYIIFCRIAALDFRYVLQQWYTAPASQCDGTPHFPNTVYQMVGLVMGNIMTLFGVWLFENYVYFWNAQKAFWVTTMFTIVAASFDVLMLTRKNQDLWSFLPFMSGKVTWLCSEGGCEEDGYRLDDLFGFLIGTQALKLLATTLDDMPSTILLSKLCPAGVETTVFAMLAALMNLGFQFSGLVASQFLQFYEVSLDKGENKCDLGDSPIEGINGLTWGLIVGGMIMPLTTIPATFFLIPNQSLDSDFVDNSAVPEAEKAAFKHPSASYSREFGAFSGLNDESIKAPQDQLERISFLSLTGRGRPGSKML